MASWPLVILLEEIPSTGANIGNTRLHEQVTLLSEGWAAICPMLLPVFCDVEQSCLCYSMLNRYVAGTQTSRRCAKNVSLCRSAGGFVDQQGINQVVGEVAAERQFLPYLTETLLATRWCSNTHVSQTLRRCLLISQQSYLPSLVPQ